ncbi:hypothetical protein AMS68_002836 [Peltaster fructicola]|uniref:Zn(2)-C6 fungal-type domain-containing protein n=1 Tax=Peltaster fructicola TaxID=286661 RepID=A0A6H0XRR5_9PEZI|nr:hypothetical protein AMS68_002836 [Peltaster fructicola]
MVYRGKPSAGCENCRKAKKRCTLEQPACTRCVKLKKECVGYRDTTQLQIQDETQSVLLKVEKRKKKATQGASTAPSQPVSRPRGAIWKVTDFNAVPMTITSPTMLDTTSPTTQASTSPIGQTSIQPGSDQPKILESDLQYINSHPLFNMYGSALLELFTESKSQQLKSLPELGTLPINAYRDSAYAINFNMSNVYTLMQWATGMPKSPKMLPDDVAINMFLNCCTADGQWSYFHQQDYMQGRDSCLDLAIKACGMAALNNVRPLLGAREWSRSMYTKAIRLLNDALKDPKRNKHDDCLVAVTMLGFYENITCDSMQSIKSWKAHIEGATQLLKLRGPTQFNTLVGRLLFRELRAQIMIACLWDDRRPPDFLCDWQRELAQKSTSLVFIGPTDTLMDISHEFAILRNAIKLKKISHDEALVQSNDIEAKLRQWAADACSQDERWKYHEARVDDSLHVWEGKVYAYSCLPIPNVWNLYRSIRILATRTHELLARSVSQTADEERMQIMYSRSIRRQMTDEICATVPCLLGHAAPAFCSPCVLVTAYSSIWPIFFAATCALERLGMNMWEQDGKSDISSHSGVKASAFSSAAAQSAWLLGRLDYISRVIGVKWAENIAGSLREAIKVHKEKAMAYHATLTPGSPAELEYISIAGEIIRGVMGWRQQLSGET